MAAVNWDPDQVVILCGSGGERLAEEIAGLIGLPACHCVSQRPGGSAGRESSIQVGLVRGRDVFVVQSTCHPVNDTIIELALMVSACQRASARRVTAVVPYLAYSRQTMKDKSRVPVSSSDVASIFEEACIDAIVTVDVRDIQIAGFFSPRVAFHSCSYMPAAARFLEQQVLKSPVVVAPHASSVPRAVAFFEALKQLDLENGLAEQAAYDAARVPPRFAMLLPNERKGDAKKELELTGDVAGRDAILVDDMVDSGTTISRSSRELIARGAARVFAFATHGLFSGDACDRLGHCPVEMIIVTNSIPSSPILSTLSPDHKLRKKLLILSIAPMLSHQICELADLPLPDVDPLAPVFALHSGADAKGPSASGSRPWDQHPALWRKGAMGKAALDDGESIDQSVDDDASQTESQTTASEFSYRGGLPDFAA